MRVLAIIVLLVLSGSAFSDMSFAPQTVTLGRLNPSITQRNIQSTICKPGWTAKQRPSLAWTYALKVRQLKALGIPAGEAGRYWADHIVPIGLGGAPRSPRNIQPQLIADAKAKDVIEIKTYHEVCRGKKTLKEGQSVFLQSQFK